MARQPQHRPRTPPPDAIDSRALIELPRGEYLIIRTLPGEATPWEFPGGITRPEESPEAALRRICREQAGVELDIVLGQPPFEYTYAERRVWFRYYLCHLRSGNPAAVGCEELRSVGKQQLREYVFEPAAQQVVDWMLQTDQDTA